jgi:hypothetical protein
MYPDFVIGMVKGLHACGISPKRIAHGTGLPYQTVKAWCYCLRSRAVREDHLPRETIGHLYKQIGDILKDQSTQNKCGMVPPQET